MRILIENTAHRNAFQRLTRQRGLNVAAVLPCSRSKGAETDLSVEGDRQRTVHHATIIRSPRSWWELFAKACQLGAASLICSVRGDCPRSHSKVRSSLVELTSSRPTRRMVLLQPGHSSGSMDRVSRDSEARAATCKPRHRSCLARLSTSTAPQNVVWSATGIQRSLNF